MGAGRDNFTVTSKDSIDILGDARPDPGSIQINPVVTSPGIDTQFISGATPQETTLTIDGEPADIRFTPVKWHWSFGGQGTDALTVPTTTQRFERAGHVTGELEIDYQVEHRSGSGWQILRGVLTVAAKPFDLEVIE